MWNAPKRNPKTQPTLNRFIILLIFLSSPILSILRRKPKVKRNLSHVIMLFIIWGSIGGLALPALNYELTQLEQNQELHKELSQTGIYLVGMLDSYSFVENNDEDGSTYTYTLQYRYTHEGKTYHIKDVRSTTSKLTESDIDYTLPIYIDGQNPDIVVYSDITKYDTLGIKIVRIGVVVFGVILTLAFC